MSLSQHDIDIRKALKASKQKVRHARMTIEEREKLNERRRLYNLQKRMQNLARQQDEIKVINYLQSTNVS